MTYNSGRPVPVEEQVFKTTTPYVAELDGRIVGTFVIMDMICTRGTQAEWKTAGIAGVAVLPEYRQAGVGSAMMKWSLRAMRDQGYVLAALYAFRESYYRRFGYENCGLKLKVTCPHARLPKIRSELPIRKLDSNDYSVIDSCYRAFAGRYSGMNLRDEMHWKRVLSDSRHIYVVGDPVEAYVILEHDWTFWNEQPIAEFVWSTDRGYKGGLSLIASVGINKATVSWHEPSDSPMLYRHLDKGMEFSIDKPIMYRLLDAKGALESLKTMERGSFSLAIDDRDFPEFGTGWNVSFGSEGVEVTDASNAQMRLTPHQAVQAFLGEPSIERLRVDAGDMSKLLPPMPTYCLDYF